MVNTAFAPKAQKKGGHIRFGEALAIQHAIQSHRSIHRVDGRHTAPRLSSTNH
jgi:hypothetical protein